MPPTAVALPTTFSVFRNRDFTLLWLAEFVSQTGTALSSLAASIWIFELTGSSFSVGLILIASALPSLFVGLIAGVLVDRMDSRRIMIAADLTRAIFALLIPWLMPYHIAWLYILIFCSNFVGQFFSSAHASHLPEVASEEELTAANSFMAISEFGSIAAGFAVSGLIASQANIELAFYLDALSFLFSAFCIWRVRPSTEPHSDESTMGAVVENLRDGLRTITSTLVLRSFFLISIPILLLTGLSNSLLLPFAHDVLHASEFEYGLMEGIAVLGLTLGSFVMVRLGDRLHEDQWLVMSHVGAAVLSIFFALTYSVQMAMIVTLFIGILNAPAIARNLIIQRNTPREARGRVFSAFFVARDAAFIAGFALSGLGDLVGVRTMMIISAVLSLVFGLLILRMPGLAHPAAQWRRALALLRHAPSAPGLGAGRLPTPGDFDLLLTRMPMLSRLDAKAVDWLLAETQVFDAPAGTVILRQGEKSDAAYFILQGRAVAGSDSSGEYRLLEVMTDGDFFGEIAALTGSLRQASVVAAEPTKLLQVPAPTLRRILADPELNRLFVSRMTQRMMRSNMVDLPRFGAKDQDVMLDLRTPQPVEG